MVTSLKLQFKYLNILAATSAIIFSAEYSLQPANAKDSCIIADPADTALNVRATPNGEIINRLRNGRVVTIERLQNDAKGRPWGYASGKYKGKHRQWGWVYMEAVNCNPTKAPKNNKKIKVDYPVFLNGDNQITQFGIHVRDFSSNNSYHKSFKRCFEFDAGHGMSLSKSLISRYENIGFNFDQICAGFQIEGLRYHPETGEKIPTYNVINMKTYKNIEGFVGSGYSSPIGEYPLILPDCFATGKIERTNNVVLYPSNPDRKHNFVSLQTRCENKYHFRHGNKLSSDDSAFFASNVGFEQGDLSPGGFPISRKQKIKLKKKKTKAEIAAILQQN